MSQAYPQFTPVQILEAGQRAFAEGRAEYATQFFKHLIDHYSDTAEAAVAREAMAQVHGASAQPQYSQPNDRHRTAPPARPSPGYAPSATANGSLQGVPLSVDGQQNTGRLSGGGHAPADHRANGHATNGANGHAHGYDADGYAAPHHSPGQQATQERQQHSETVYGRAPPPAGDMSQHYQARARGAESMPHPDAPTHHMLVPAPEKNYIIGRVVAGLLLLIGILGIFAGIVLVYAAISDPGIYARFGMGTSAQALLFSGSVCVGSVAALIAAQMATAMFDGADAVADLARLQRYRLGDINDDDA